MHRRTLPVLFCPPTCCDVFNCWLVQIKELPQLRNQSVVVHWVLTHCGSAWGVNLCLHMFMLWGAQSVILCKCTSDYSWPPNALYGTVSFEGSKLYTFEYAVVVLHCIKGHCKRYTMYTACHVLCMPCTQRVVYLVCRVLCMPCTVFAMYTACQVLYMPCTLHVVYSACHVLRMAVTCCGTPTSQIPSVTLQTENLANPHATLSKCVLWNVPSKEDVCDNADCKPSKCTCISQMCAQSAQLASCSFDSLTRSRPWQCKW